ncbi:alpha/beta hydrolase [Mycobacterium sp. ITM-2016-00317]|uniref:alpha/beta hydrolase n=1 Tax=Mycobacterium sp. ITM-2016-00317 TaxID=2099694 RepID=UPI00287F4235|nr:alpha/beta hydrolase [Mycobacterium sp. ITM-2016-00317]WNG87617.1 alpha/beta hydrolase [Mycobacterium sp. ITM-2016-00317]
MKNVVRSGAAAMATLAAIASGVVPTSQASPPAQPTIVMVHGAWADTSSWDGELGALKAKGYVARAVANPLRNLASDARSVASFLETINGPVVLVGHSYGGAVISEAAASSPNVKALVFVDAYLPEVGESVSTLNGDGSIIYSLTEQQLFDTFPDPGSPDGATDLLLKKDVFQQHFASDLPAEHSARLWASERVTSTAALKTPSTATGWKTVPSWAFISTGDQIITGASKHSMAQRAGALITTFEGGSHLTLISHPDAVAAVIDSAATGVA